ncbi:hypothetical protein BGZ51_001612 [Haplosporangium sp. Z 767]|nr:hypothetical protein BGZ51_001612 [Haplosporangium sp. Z 767]
MSATTTCDHMWRFTYVSTSYVGLVYDSSAYKNSRHYKDKDQFFQRKRYLLTDAAYALTSSVILLYKNVTGDQERFNKFHGVTRVKIEHAFGMLKLKLQSLQNLLTSIGKSRDIGKVSRWIMTCMT